MTTETDIQYRVLQNSLSRFSVFLNKAESLAAIGECLLQNTKYLFDYSFCRFHYFQQETFVCYTINRFEAKVETGSHPFFYDVENEIFNTAVPHYEKKTGYGCSNHFENTNEVWIWKFTYGDDAGILVNVSSNGEHHFLKEQIPVLKTASEMLFTKTRMVLLMNELQDNQNALLASYKKLEESNAIITNLLALQEKKVEDRTQALSRTNAKLVEMIQFNSHNIREPLTRVLGIMSLYELVTQNEFFEAYWPLLLKSFQDMDTTIRKIIFKIEKIDNHESFFN